MSKRNSHIEKNEVPVKGTNPLFTNNEYSKKKAKEAELKEKKKSERSEQDKLKFADYMRIVKNGFTTVLLNVVQGKAPFGEVKPNVILWIIVLTIVLLIIEKVF